jgi:hypothetical protein
VRLPTHRQVVVLSQNASSKQGRLVLGLAVLAAQLSERTVIYHPYSSAAGQYHLKQVKDFQWQHAEHDPDQNEFVIHSARLARRLALCFVIF